MKHFVKVALFSLFLLAFFPLPEAMAVGLGWYWGGAGGSATWDYDYDYGSRHYSGRGFDTTPLHFGTGIVFDTAVAKDTLLNYRLNLGYERWEDDVKDSNTKYQMDSAVLRNTLGFGVLRTKMLRLWLGPQFSLSYAQGNPESDSNFDIKLFGVGFGPAVGLNLNLGKVVTLAFTFGGRYTWYTGTGDRESYYYNYDYDYKINEFVGFINMALLFRIRDTY